jgi:hypothetical protein
VPYATQVGKIEMHTTTLWPDMIASASDNATIEVSGLDVTGVKVPDSKPQDHIVLNMAGFSSAYAKLSKVCTETASAYDACDPAVPSSRCR